MSDITQEMINQRVNTGLKNLWHPVLPSWGVYNDPVGITRLSENIALWRDDNGNVRAIEDRCPHRGARVSLGWNLGERVACWYHGIEIAGDGTVIDVPAVENCPMVGKKLIKSYPVKEVHNAIFLYFGDESHQEPPELELPDELVSEDYSNFLCTAKWSCNYRYAIDNVMDPMHGAYLHAVSHSMAFGDKTAEMQVVKTNSGIIFEKIAQRDVNFDWVEIGETGALWMRLSIPYRKSAGPGGSFNIVGFATPVDEGHCQVFFWRTRKVSGWQKDVWRFLYKNKLERLHWDVLEQDRIILQEMAPNARDSEMLYEHDQGLASVRRIMKQKAENQLRSRVAAE